MINKLNNFSDLIVRIFAPWNHLLENERRVFPTNSGGDSGMGNFLPDVCVLVLCYLILKGICYMKIALIIVRLLVGAIFLFASVMVLFKLAPQPELQGNPKLFMDGVEATGYLLTLIKLTELVCSLAFLSGRYVTLAAVVIFPVTVNILLYHIFVLPQGLPVAIAVFLGNLFIAYSHRQNYRALFTVK